MQLNDETAAVGIQCQHGECKEQTPKQVIKTAVDVVGKTTNPHRLQDLLSTGMGIEQRASKTDKTLDIWAHNLLS